MFQSRGLSTNFHTGAMVTVRSLIAWYLHELIEPRLISQRNSFNRWRHLLAVPKVATNMVVYIMCINSPGRSATLLHLNVLTWIPKRAI